MRGEGAFTESLKARPEFAKLLEGK